MADPQPVKNQGHDPTPNREADDNHDRGPEGVEIGAGTPLPEAPECPFCRKHETELMSAFGSHASVSTFWCRTCRSPFEVFSWR